MSETILKIIKTKLENEIFKLETKKKDLISKFSSIKTRLFSKIIKEKCFSQLKSIEKYGKVQLNQEGNVKIDLNKEGTDEEEKVTQVISQLNVCYLENSYGIGSIEDDFEKKLYENMKNTKENLEACLTQGEENLTTCIEKGIRVGIKEYSSILSMTLSRLVRIEKIII